MQYINTARIRDHGAQLHISLARCSPLSRRLTISCATAGCESGTRCPELKTTAQLILPADCTMPAGAPSTSHAQGRAPANSEAADQLVAPITRATPRWLHEEPSKLPA